MLNFEAFLSTRIQSPDSSPVTCVSWNSINDLIACGHKNGLVSIAYLESNPEHAGLTQIKVIMTLLGHRHEITTITWNDRFSKLISTDNSGHLILWTERDEKWVQMMSKEGDGKSITDLCLTQNGEFVFFGTSNGNLVCGSHDGRERWDIHFHKPISKLAWSAEYKLLIVSFPKGRIKFVRLDGKIAEKFFSIPNSFSPDSLLLASSSTKTIFANSSGEVLIDQKVIETKMEISCISFSHDGSMFVISGSPSPGTSSLQFYTPEGIQIRSLNLNVQNISSICFDSRNEFLVAGIGSAIGIVQIIPIQKYCFLKNTLVYNHEKDLIFFNIITDELHVKEIEHVDGLTADEYVVLIVSGTTLLICDEFGLPLSSLNLSFAPTMFSISNKVAGAALGKNLILWNYESGEIKHVQTSVITCIKITKNFLFVAFESKELVLYSIPDLEEQSRFILSIKAESMEVSSDFTRLALLDIFGNLSFLDLHSGSPQISHRKDAWCIRWASDSPEYFVSLERQQLYVYHGFQPEEAIVSLTYICEYKDLQIRTVDFFSLFMDPLKPKKSLFYLYESKPLRDLKLLLKSEGVSIEEITNYVQEKSHPVLWQLLAEHALENSNLTTAKKCLSELPSLACKYFIQKVTKQASNPKLQRAYILWYLKKYDEAASFFIQANRNDLAVDIYISLGNWEKVLELTAENDKEMLNKAHEMLGSKNILKYNYKEALEHFKQSGNKEQVINCLFKLKDMESLTKMIETLPKASNDIKKIGETMLNYGAIEEAAKCFIKIGYIKTAVDIYIKANKWKKAFRIVPESSWRELHKHYANHKLSIGQVSKALSVFLRYSFKSEAANLLTNEGNNYLKKKQFVESKKCFVLAALQEHDAEIWHKAEAIHFLLVAHRLIYQEMWIESIEVANRLFLVYSDFLGKENTSAILVLCGLGSQYYEQCSKGFVVLENSKKYSKNKKTRFENISFKIFSKIDPEDPLNEERNCPKCEKNFPYPQTKCRCGYVTTPSIVSGSSIEINKNTWKCKRCRHCALKIEMKDFGICPLCHVKV